MYLKYVKRIIDILISMVIIIILMPIYLIIAIIIELIDKGPIIYKQNRTGMLGEPFKIYKFKTMKNGETTQLR